MKNAVALNDKELEMVAGGDYGDTARDNGAQPRYKVGEVVEQYWTDFHWHTHKRKIVAVRKYPKCWVYLFSDNPQAYEHTANDFQSK